MHFEEEIKLFRFRCNRYTTERNDHMIVTMEYSLYSLNEKVSAKGK